jgi:membrane protein
LRARAEAPQGQQHIDRLGVLSPEAKYVLTQPGGFALQVLRNFRANQGLLLAGAVAYYALLSIVPLVILIVIALSHVVDQAELLDTLERYLRWLAPGRAESWMPELADFLAHREIIGWVLLATMVFFSSMAFTVLENAMAMIFQHRAAVRRRHFLVSALLPYCCIVVLAIALLLVTLMASILQAIGEDTVRVLGFEWSLGAVSRVLLYALGVGTEILIMASIYLIMPVGRLSVRHALIGAITATVLWELTRNALVWYFARLWGLTVIYGSLTTAIIVLISLEIAAIALLLGAQVISVYERLPDTDLVPGRRAVAD